MTKNEWIASVAVLVMVAGCPAEDGDGANGGSVAEETGNPDETGGSEGTGGTDDPEEPGETEGPDEPEEPADLLEECRLLPAAADWVEGEAPQSAAESTPERVAVLGAVTWEIALDLLRAVDSSEAASLAASPASMVTAMGLAYGRWQGGQCGDRIAEVMRFPELEDDLHHTIGESIEALQSRALPATDDADPVRLLMRQSTWEFGTGELPEPSELQTIYGAKPNAMLERGEPARELINCIIEAESDGLLPDFLPIGQPADDTTSYDVNVAVLKAPWSVGMTPQQIDFNFADGTTASVDGFGTEYVGAQLYDSDIMSMVDVRLRGEALSVMIVMPPEGGDGGLDALQMALDAGALEVARDQAQAVDIAFSMPKFAIDSGTLDYNDRLGFECEVFTLRSVFHSAVVEIDEKGIKAAAATVAEGFEDGGPEAVAFIEVDRPFLFFVHDAETDIVLYSGRYSP